jgi:hypothetical protein
MDWLRNTLQPHSGYSPYPMGHSRRRGIGTIEEQRRNKQIKAPKKSPYDRVYRPFAGYIRNPDKNRPPKYIFIHNALLRYAGYLIIDNWLNEPDWR